MTGFPIAGPSLMLCTPASPLMVSPSDGAWATRRLSPARTLVGCGDVSALVAFGVAVSLDLGQLDRRWTHRDFEADVLGHRWSPAGRPGRSRSARTPRRKSPTAARRA